MQKTAFITGANRGLGRGFVDYLLNTDYYVFSAVRSLPIVKLNNPNHDYIILDVSSDASIEQAAKLLTSREVSLDLLINKAGINKDTATGNKKEKVCQLEDLDRHNLLKMFDINSISPLMITKNFLPLLNKNPSFLINISSDRASYHDEFSNSTANYGYRSSKIALNMMTFCSVTDLPENIKTFAVHPGDVKSDMNPNGEDLPVIQAEKIINITKNWKSEFNGRFLRFDGSFYPI